MLISLSCLCVFSHFSHVWLLVTPWTVACQAPLSMGFSRQEHWRGLPCPPPGDLPDPGIGIPLILESMSSAKFKMFSASFFGYFQCPPLNFLLCFWDSCDTNVEFFATVWSLKKWCFWTVVLEKTFESPLDCREIKPVSPKGNQSWVSIGRTDTEAEAPILWPPDVKSQLTGKKPWCWEKLKAGGEGDDRGWNGWIASPSQWTWVWASSGRWWRTGKPGVLQYGVTKSWTRLRDWITTRLLQKL